MLNKKILILFVCIALVASLFLTSCTTQEMAKNFGGDMVVELDPGEKLEMITWKDDSLWYLTRPMRADEFAETHVFEQSSAWGMFEGTVTVIESQK